MIYYLAHPWSNDPTQSFINAVSWTQKLRDIGYYVFSPILHSHPYWEFLKSLNSKNAEIYLEDEDFIEWNLQILKEFKDVIILMSNTAYTYNDKGQIGWFSLGCRLEYLFAIEHGIKIYELEAFFDGRIVKIKEESK